MHQSSSISSHLRKSRANFSAGRIETDRPQSVRAFDREVSRLLSAAVVSRSFARTLLSDPGEALETGYQGHVFTFTDPERQILISLEAETIQEFAAEVAIRFSFTQMDQYRETRDGGEESTHINLT